MRRPAKLAFFILFVVWSLGVGAPARAAVTSIAVGPRPESVVRGWNDKLYVSIQGPSNDLGVLDGEIRVVDLGTGKAAPFASGFENPRGLTFTGKELVVADQKKIYRVDASGNKTLLATTEQMPSTPANFFNDIATEPGGKAVFVTEMGRRDLIRTPATTPPGPQHLIPVDSPAAYDVPPLARVYRITLDKTPKITSMFEPSRKLLVINGVTPSRKKPGDLLVLDFFHGSIVEVEPKPGGKGKAKMTILATGLRGADGIEQGKDGTLYVSSFENGMVWKLDPDGDNLRVLLNEAGFQTTADLALDEKAKKLYVPNTAAGTIMVLPTEE
jgi:sugar lactone lactonase YvrE